jgi:hypothetical protein
MALPPLARMEPPGPPHALRWVLRQGLSAGLCGGLALVASDIVLAGVVPGLVAHLVFAVIVAVGLAAVVAATPAFARSPWAIHAAGLVAGVLLWLHALYIVLPALGAAALGAASNPTLQLTSHAVVFGIGIAAWFDAKLPVDGFATRWAWAAAPVTASSA